MLIVHLCHRALQQAVTCQLDYIHTRVLRACPIRNMYFIISVVDQSASPRTKTKTDGYHTLPAVLNNNNNNNSNPILSSRTTVVAWTHVIINPPHRDQAKAHGVCVCRRHRRPRSAEAGKSDPIACGPRCLSLHSTLHKHHHHLPLRLSLRPL